MTIKDEFKDKLKQDGFVAFDFDSGTIINDEFKVEKIKKKPRSESTGKDHSPNSRTTRYHNLRKKIKSSRKTQKRTDRFYIGKNN